MHACLDQGQPNEVAKSHWNGLRFDYNPLMNTIVVDQKRIRIPPGVHDLDSFRQWVHSSEFPEQARVCYLQGEIWVDMSKEQFTHNQIKGEIASVLTMLAKNSEMGRFFSDGYLLTNDVADLSTNPDGMFASAESLRSGRVQVPGAEEGLIELNGSPDMSLEVLSPSSVEKDTVQLRRMYWEAEIQEYWIVDTRPEIAELTILRHGSRGYTPTRMREKSLRSNVFQKSFHLRQGKDLLGYPAYSLEMH